MTFEPTEIEQLPLPLLPHNHTINIKEIDALVRERKIDEVLDIIDQHLLIAHLGFEKEVVERFYKTACFCLDNGRNEKALFDLHQATQHTCMVLLRIYTGYRSIRVREWLITTFSITWLVIALNRIW